MYTITPMGNELYHYGVMGMKWGVRRYQPYPSGHTGGKFLGKMGGTSSRNYKSTSIRASISRMKNKKVDKSFDKWKEESKKRENAINVGKDYNEKRFNYENDRTKENKAAYKSSKKEYKKSLRSNTIYRRGQVKNEVGQDMARKYLTEANRVKKRLDKDPGNKDLQKKYNKLMSQHDIERANARRAPEVYANRSRRVASIKRTATMTLKGAAATAVIAAGGYAVNKYLKSKGINVRLDTDKIKKGLNFVKSASRYV